MTTLTDTFVVALVLRSWNAAGVVMALMLMALGLAIFYMAAYRRSSQILDRVLDLVAANRTTLVLFLLSLVAAPILVFVMGSWL